MNEAIPQGFSQSGLGNTDYSTNPCSTSLKFDTTGDYLLLYFTGVATSLSYKMKANTGTNNNDWTGIFTVEESVDGNSWTVLRTINSNTTSITTSNAGTVFTDTPLSTSRYFRWTYTTETNGNLAFCDVNVSNSTPPANDECANATNLTCGTLNLAGTTVRTIAETAPGGSTYASRYGGWYTFLGNEQSTTISSTSTNGSFQDSPYFTVQEPGEYEVIVRDKNFCGETRLVAHVINFPPFFTPNNDGFNDTWNVIGLPSHFNAKISIFDRYGKLLFQFNPKTSYWNGQYNNQPVPSTDYWFTIDYTDDKNNKHSYQSHFSLVR